MAVLPPPSFAGGADPSFELGAPGSQSRTSAVLESRTNFSVNANHKSQESTRQGPPPDRREKQGDSKPTTAPMLRQHATKSTAGCIKRQLVGLQGARRAPRTQRPLHNTHALYENVNSEGRWWRSKSPDRIDTPRGQPVSKCHTWREGPTRVGQICRQSWRLTVRSRDLAALAERIRSVPGVTGFDLAPRDD